MKKTIKRSLPSFNRTHKPASVTMKRHNCADKCITPHQRNTAALKRALRKIVWPTLA